MGLLKSPIAFFLLLSFLFGCDFISGHSQYIKDESGRITIIPHNASVSRLSILSWPVGTGFQSRVSKGIQFRVDLPLITKAQMEDLVFTMNTDSWLIKITSERFGRTDTLGYALIPIIVPGQNRQGRLRISQIKNIFINIYYTAAYASTRLEKLQCPAFDHDYLIGSLTLHKSPPLGKELSVSRGEQEVIVSAVEDYSYKPVTFNGGHQLAGEYQIHLALLNSKNKTRRSSYYTYTQAVDVGQEVKRAITGCSGALVPPRDQKEYSIKDFSFGKKKD